MTTATAARESAGASESVVQRRPASSVEPESPVTDSRWVPSTFRVQTSSLRVSTASDPAEREAESVSERVVATNVGSAPPSISCAPSTSGAPARRGDEADLRSELGGGAALPSKVAKSMGESLGADFSGVRIHTDARAASLANRFAAKAFTVGSEVFFSKGSYRPDSPEGRKLLAHELVHVVQQGGAGRKTSSGAGARNVSRSAAGVVQRLGVSDALDYFADKANLIPGFRMLTILMGFNPIDMSRVERTAANVLRAVIEFVPGGALITQALDNHGIFEKAGAWVGDQLKALGDIGSSIKQALKEFIDGLSWSDIFDLGGVWERAKRIFTDPVVRIKDFVVGLATGFVTLVKDAILKPIGALAKGTEGWNLLCAVLGKDPITGEAVPRDAETLIGGFLRLIGQGEVWENMKKANAIPRAFAWFKGAMADLVGFVSQIPSLFVQAFTSLELLDIVLLPKAFLKVGKVFGGFLLQFVSWAGNAIWNLLEIIFDCVSPGAWAHIKKTGAALKSILKNPLPFMKNLVKAGIGGFDAFKKNFGKHLQTGLIDWLTGSLPGVYIPKSFALKELVTFVLSALGVSWKIIRGKIAKVVGEPAMKTLETTFDIVVTLVREGPAAAWEKIKDELGNLKEMVVGGIVDMVVGLIAQKAIPKLIAMFIPGAGFISAILAIYDTVMVFVQKISKIIQVVTAFVNSIAQIAAGNVGAAVAKVESVLAGLLGLAINFLMGFAGLGKIADKIMGVIAKIRAKVDAALDKVVAWIAKMGKAALAKAKTAIGNWWKAKKGFEAPDGKRHTLYLEKAGSKAVLTMRSDPVGYKEFLANLDPSKADPKALALAKKVDAAMDAAASENPPDDAAQKLETLLEQLAAKTGPMMAKASIASTAPIYGGLVGGFGSSATVLRLTSSHGKGSTPSVEDGLWDVLRARRDGAGSYYVRGHLLNHNIGGPGSTWSNLTPITQFTNNRADDSMLKVFETPIKDATTAGEAITFSVTAQYGRSHPLAAKAAKWKSDPDKDVSLMGKVIEAEKFVPLSLSCKGVRIDAKGKALKTYGPHVVPNLIADREADYLFDKVSKSDYRISNKTAKELASDLAGLDLATATKIANNGPYASIDEVPAKAGIPESSWKLARETPRKRLVP